MSSTPNFVAALLAGPALMAAGIAAAETSPYYLGVNQAFSYESNVFNLESGAPAPPSVQSLYDTLSITTIKAGIDQPQGRQRYFVTANVNYSVYQHNDQLNNTGYGLEAGLDWATIERLTGTVRIAANQGLSGFNLYGSQQTYQKNVQDTQQGSLSARWGITPRLAIDGAYIFRNVKMSAPSAENNEYTQNTGILGLGYGGDGVLEMGLQYRYSGTNYPRYSGIGTPCNPCIADDATGNNIDLTAKWVPSGQSKLEARLSFTDVTHTENIGNDFRGLTGMLRWEYHPTGKLFTRLSLLVAPGSGATFDGFTGNATPFANNGRSSSSIRLGATYLATGKTQFSGGLSYDRDQLAQTDATGAVQTGSATNTGADLGVKYSATNYLDLACNVSYQARSTSSSLSHPYSGSAILCSAELLLK